MMTYVLYVILLTWKLYISPITEAKTTTYCSVLRAFALLPRREPNEWLQSKSPGVILPHLCFDDSYTQFITLFLITRNEMDL